MGRRRRRRRKNWGQFVLLDAPEKNPPFLLGKKLFSTKERVSVFFNFFSGEVHHLGLFEFEMRRYLFLPLLYGRGEVRGRRSILPVCQLRSFRRRRRRRNPFFTQQEASSFFSLSLSPPPPKAIGKKEGKTSRLTTKKRETQNHFREEKEDENRAALFTSQFSPTRKWGKKIALSSCPCHTHKHK